MTPNCETRHDKRYLPSTWVTLRTVIFDELGVQHGLARIDLAVVNGELLPST